MSFLHKVSIGLLLICYLCCGQVPSNPAAGLNMYEAPHKRFEYKYSFKGPYLSQADLTVPFWTYSGNAMASEDMIRITPSLRSKKGSVWSAQTVFDWWEVELWFRVNGKGRVGADGLAFWFTDIQYPEGPVFGSADKWRGLGVFFDSFDNDGRGNNPYIMAMVNDGTKIYDHETDGSNQQLAGCLRDFRNKPFPTRAKIEYYKNVLTLSFHSGNTINDDDYEICFRVENVFLPQRGHFGLSAATGGLADDHDALKFLTHSLLPPSQTGGQPGINDQEKEKTEKVYEMYKEKLEKQKTDYFKQHPDEAKKFKETEDLDSEYETLAERELLQIFTGQSQMFDVLKNLNRKLDELLGRQERTLSMISNVQMGAINTQPQQHPGQQHPGQQLPPPPPILRHEVESLLALQKEIVQDAREIKVTVQKQQPASMQQGQASQHLNQQLMTEIRDSINVLRKEITSIGTKMMAQGGRNCPSVSCLSPSIFFITIICHLIVVLGYLLFKSSKENQAKKFY